MQKSGLKLNKLNALACKQLATPEKKLILNDCNTLLLSINGNCMEFCFIYILWWFFEAKAFCALRKKAKIGKLQRLKMGLGMSNIALK